MLLKGTLNQGRIYHILRDSNKHKRIQASRLVALAWVPNPESKLMYVIKIITLAIIYILIFIGVHRKKIYNSVSGIIDLDLKVKYPYLILNLNKDYLNGVTIKELKQKYNITHIHRYVKETKKRYRLGHDRVRELIRDKAKGYSNKELGEKYKLSKASISHYLNRIYENN